MYILWLSSGTFTYFADSVALTLQFYLHISTYWILIIFVKIYTYILIELAAKVNSPYLKYIAHSNVRPLHS